MEKMQSTMSCPRAGPSSDLLIRPAPSKPRGGAASRSSKVVGHFDPAELTRRLNKVLADQRRHEELKRIDREDREARSRLVREQAKQNKQLAQQHEGHHLEELPQPSSSHRHIPREAAKQFTRTTTAASTVAAIYSPQGKAIEPSRAMRYNQGLPVVPAPIQTTTTTTAGQTASFQTFQFPFPSPHHQPAASSSSSNPSSTGETGPGSNDSTPPPSHPAASTALRFPLGTSPLTKKQGKQPQQVPEPATGRVSVSASASSTLVAASSTADSASAVSWPPESSAAAGPVKGGSSRAWSPLLKKADSLWGLRGGGRPRDLKGKGVEGGGTSSIFAPPPEGEDGGEDKAGWKRKTFFRLPTSKKTGPAYR